MHKQAGDVQPAQSILFIEYCPSLSAVIAAQDANPAPDTRRNVGVNGIAVKNTRGDVEAI